MSYPKHPIITFQANLSPDNMSFLSPARSGSNQTQDVLDEAQFANLISALLPGREIGDFNLKNGNQFVAYGMDAIYLKNTYAVAAVGRTPLLTVVSYQTSSVNNIPT